jgi:predicted  nucleic acid-binding Zn-ribbon protein
LSIPEQIRALEELAALDAELRTLDEQLLQERSALSGLKAELKKLNEKLADGRTALTANEKNRNEFISDVRTMMNQLEHSREKLNRSRTERETNAAQRELEELRKLIRDREDEVGKLTTEGEAVRLQNEAVETEAKALVAQLGSSEGDINTKLGDVEAQRNKKNGGREAIVKRLPVPLYRRYETIRAKKGTAIAQTSDGTCKACHMALPPQLYHRLRREPLLEQCQSCQRIIYFVPPQSPTQS